MDEYISIGECVSNGRERANGAPTHSEILLPMIDNLLTHTGLTAEDIDTVAYTSGPGSFTGLRVGAATAQGLARGAGRKLLPVPTLDALAYNIGCTAAPGELIVPLMDARRGQVYAAFYQGTEQGRPQRLTEYMALPVSEMLEKLRDYPPTRDSRRLFLGDGASAYQEAIAAAFPAAVFAPPAMNRQRASSAALCALHRLGDGESPGDTAELLYIRQPQAVREREERA